MVEGEGPAPKARPILFSAPMVRAILDRRKTQTRRIVKIADILDFVRGNDGVWTFQTPTGAVASRCPYGVPGDRLWVKETWRPFSVLNPWDLRILYAADGAERWLHDGDFQAGDWIMPKAAERGFVSPLFMPRWASRILLQITDVRVERLQDISEADAIAEGLKWIVPGMWSVEGAAIIGDDPRKVYAELWNHINGPGAWDANPWVWVVTFERVTP